MGFYLVCSDRFSNCPVNGYLANGRSRSGKSSQEFESGINMDKLENIFVLRFLRWFCPEDLYEGIEGDLLEQFEEDLKPTNRLERSDGYLIRRARRKFVWNTINFFRPEIIFRNRFAFTLINTIMIGNYFKVASRNILKRKMFSFINAFGLSIGIAFCILIYLYIQDERSFDQFHKNKNLIYRLEEKSYDTWQHKSKDPYNHSAYLMKSLKQAVKDELPEIALATHYNPEHYGIVKHEDKIFTEKEIAFVDADFFKMFSFRVLAGNSEK